MQQQIIQLNKNGQVDKQPFTTEVVDVTPDTARQWLSIMRKNRNLNKDRVSMYAKEMSAGRWMLTGEAIKFDDNGYLFDGQTRLNAVIKSGQTIPFLVVRGVPYKAMEVADSGQPRSIHQSAQISGRGNVQSQHIACLKAMFLNPARRSIPRNALSQSELLKYLDKYRSSIDFACKKYSATKNSVKVGAVTATIAKAHHLDFDIDLLSRFSFILDNGYSAGQDLEPQDKAAVLLRTHILNLKAQGVRLSRNEAAFELQLKAEWALHKFIERQEVHRISSASRFYFPIELDGLNLKS